MACCGQRRQMMFRSVQVTPTQVTHTPMSLEPNPATVSIVFAGDTAIVIRGAVTSRTYLFPRAPASLPVDARDAPVLLADSSFRLEQAPL